MFPIWLLLLATNCVSSGPSSAADIAARYALNESTTLTFPNDTLSSSKAANFIVANWGLSKGRIQDSEGDISFVKDPFPNSTIPSNLPSATGTNSSTPVLRVDYPSKAFGSNSSGIQFLSLFNGSSSFQSMLVTYEVAFDNGFDWVKGGRLPGLSGGAAADHCSASGGANGTTCFALHVDWRANGTGEGTS
jgi:hypothetical protein